MAKLYINDPITAEERALTDCEVEYMGNLEQNEVLFEYFNTLKDGLCCTLLQSKIVQNGRIKFDGATKAMQACGKIPVVGAILFAGGKELMNEMEITNKLQYIRKLFQTLEQVPQIAYELAARLTLDQRNVIN